MASTQTYSTGRPASGEIGRCPRCGADPVPLSAAGFCELCETDRSVLRAVADWCSSAEARAALEIGADPIAAAFEYELFACALHQVGPAVREEEG